MILKGTQRQPFTSSNELIVYNKQATFHDAVQDFYSLEPAYVRQNPHGALVGNVGDVDVFLRGPDKERNLIATLVVPGGQHVKRMGFTGPSQFKTTRVIHYVSEY